MLNDHCDASPAKHYGNGINLAQSVVVSANSLWNIVNFRGGLIREISAQGLGIVVATPPDKSLGIARATPARLEPMPMDRAGLNPVADALLTVRYYRLLRDVRPAALLSFTIKPNIYGALAARLARVPAMSSSFESDSSRA